LTNKWKVAVNLNENIVEKRENTAKTGKKSLSNPIKQKVS
jgi:hypothetical protein